MQGKLLNPYKRFPFVRIFATCLVLAAIGAVMAFSAGSNVDSSVGIAGAILVLFAVLTGLAALLTAFVLDVPAILRSLNRQVADGDRRNEPVCDDASGLQSSNQLPARVTIVTVFVVAVILFFNIAILAFLFSPLSKNPIALLIVALTGFAIAASFLVSARVRMWLRQVLTAERG